MNKKALAKTIIETIDNFRSIGDSEEDILESVEGYLSVLEPKDKEQFAQWGFKNQQTSTEKCWD